MRVVAWRNPIKLGLFGALIALVLAACAAPAPTAAPKPTEAPRPVAPAAALAATTAPAAPAATAAPQPAEVFKPVAATAAPKPTEAPRPAAPAATTAPILTAPNVPAIPNTPPSAAGSAAVAPAAKVVETPPTQNIAATAVTPESTKPAATPQLPLPATQAIIEPRVVEVEYPPHMRLGDSEMIRLSLVPSAEGYTLTLDAPNNEAITRTVSIKRPLNTEVSAEARLSGVGFEIAEHNPKAVALPEAEVVTWRWTVSPRETGQHKLTISVDLIWMPLGSTAPSKRSQLFSKGFDIQVQSLLGLTSAQSKMLGAAGLTLGAGLSLAALILQRKRKFAQPQTGIVANPHPAPPALMTVPPNTALAIEASAGIELHPAENNLLQALFRDYSRVMVEREFRSGYSGARTLLILPIRNDGRADAYTIAKMGTSNAIVQEYQNFERYVKHTLPPITARIQEAPVKSQEPRVESQGSRLKAQGSTLKAQGSILNTQHSALAVLRYTFVGEAGKMPMSLGEALREPGNVALLRKLFDTFGPNWWFQRRPYSFRLGQEYDRVLPAHLIVAPAAPNDSPAHIIDGQLTAGASAPAIAIGTCVLLRNFGQVELGASDNRYALIGAASAGQAPLRVRCANWVNTRQAPEAACTQRGLLARVIGTRESLLRDAVAGLSLFGLPNPLPSLPRLLNEQVSGSQSTIHGDLNLENALVGPGGFIWLIDFATTRDGHTLFDFAHLHTEIIAHIIAPHSPIHPNLEHPLLSEMNALAQRCWFNPTQAREYDLARFVSCLGALKHRNLDEHQRHWLYLTAAQIGQRLG